MLVPVRCFTCGNVVADKFEDFQNKIKAGEDATKVLDSLENGAILLQKNAFDNCRINSTSNSIL